MEASPSFDPRRLRIGALLLRGGLLDAEQLAEALDEKEVTGERLGQIVLRRGWVTEEALAQALADQSGLDFVDLDTATRESRAELLLSGKLARYFRCVPLAVLDEQSVLVAASDPTSPLLADLPSAIGHGIRVAVATETAIERVLAVLDPDGAPASPPPLLDQSAEAAALDPLVDPSGEPLLRLSVAPSATADDPQPEPEAETMPEPNNARSDEPELEPEPESPVAEQPEPAHDELEPEWTEPSTPSWLYWNQPDVDAEPAADDPLPEPAPDELEPGSEVLLTVEPPAEASEPSWSWRPELPETDEAEADEPPIDEGEPAYDQPWSLWLMPHTEPESDPAGAATFENEADGDVPFETDDTDVPPVDAPAPSFDEVLLDGDPDPVIAAANEMIAAMAGSSRQQLGMMLLQRGLLTPGQLVEALLEEDETGMRLGTVIAGRGWISQTELARVLAEQHGLEYFDLGVEPPGPDASGLLPEASAREHRAVPVRLLDDGTLLVAVADPTDLPDRLSSDAGRRLQFAVSAAVDVDRALERLYETAEPAVAEAGEPDPAEPVLATDSASELADEPWLHDPEPADDTSPSLGALWSRDDDRSGEHEDDSPEPDMEHADGLNAATAPAPEQPLAEPVGDPTTDAPPEHAPIDGAAGLEGLGLGPETVAALQAALGQPHGLVLAVGPAASGRTATLRTALDELLDATREVVAVEGRSAHGRALRTAIQSEPAILLVDDLEHAGTARAAVDAALRGHLVLSTLHAPTAGSAVARLTAAGIDRQLLAATLTCIVGQRLARRLCATCREPYEAGRSSLIAAGFGDTYLPDAPFVGVYRPRGCPECDGGYAGRIGLFELLSVSAPIRRVLETGNASDIDSAAAYGGTRTLLADGLRHCLAGRTTLAEVGRVVGARPL
jgi:type IV pilus assembly protein PilB